MNANALPAESRETWSVTVLYEDTQVRERAMAMCDHLMRRFWSEIEFGFDWWRVGFLEDETLAHQAGGHVADADVLILALHGTGEFPAALKACLEAGMATRGVRQGAFIALFDVELKNTPGVIQNSFYLRTLAEWHGMDYLTEAPALLPGVLPDSLDKYSERAEEHTTTMENILQHPHPPNMRL